MSPNHAPFERPTGGRPSSGPIIRPRSSAFVDQAHPRVSPELVRLAESRRRERFDRALRDLTVVVIGVCIGTLLALAIARLP